MIYLYVYGGGLCATERVPTIEFTWSSKNNFQELVLSFLHVSPSELRSSGFVADNFICWAISLVQL